MHESRGSMVALASFISVVVGRFGAEEQVVLVSMKLTNAARQQKGRRRLSFVSAAILRCPANRTESVGIGVDRMDPVRAAAPAKRCSRVLGVESGAEILPRVRRARDVEQLLGLTAALRAKAANPCDLSAVLWIVFERRLRARETLPAFRALAQAAVIRNPEFGL